MGAIEIASYILTLAIIIFWASIRFGSSSRKWNAKGWGAAFFIANVLPLIAVIACIMALSMSPSATWGFTLFSLLGLGLLASAIELRGLHKRKGDASPLFDSLLIAGKDPRLFFTVLGLLIVMIAVLLLIAFAWTSLTNPVLDKLMNVNINTSPQEVAAQAEGMKQAIVAVLGYSALALIAAFLVFSFAQSLIWGVLYRSKRMWAVAWRFMISSSLWLLVASIPLTMLLFFASRSVNDESSATAVILAFPFVIALILYLYMAFAAAYHSSPSWFAAWGHGLFHSMKALPMIAVPLCASLFFLFVLDIITRPFVETDALVYLVAVVFLAYASWSIILFAKYLQQVFPVSHNISRNPHGQSKKR